MGTFIFLIFLIQSIMVPVLCPAQNQKVWAGDVTRNISYYENNWLGEDYSKILKLMGATYSKPREFDEILGWESFNGYPKLKKIVTSGCSVLYSKDRQCVAMFPLFRPLTPGDTLYIISMKRYSPDDPLRVLDMQHMWSTRADIIFAMGHYHYFLHGRNDIDWRQYLEYYPEEKAKSIFNADTAFRVSLNFKPVNEYYDYQGKYKYLDTLVIQKKGRGYIMMYIFTTEEGHKKFPEYLEQIEGMFRYEDWAAL